MGVIMTQRYDVLLSGAYFCDLIFNGLPELPQLGRDIFSSAFEMKPGGAFYTALTLQRLGVSGGWLCDVGDDFFSRFIIEEAEAEGIDTSFFIRHDRPARRVAAAFSYAHERGFISYSDDEMPDELPWAALAQYQPRCLLLSHLGYWSELHMLTALPQRDRLLVYLDCQDTTLSLDDTPGLAEALGHADVFAPNEAEALRLTGTATAEAALERLAEHVPTAVIKLGHRGAIAQRGRERVAAPPIAVSPVDTTGAGDCFNAGFVYGLLQDVSLVDCLRYGNIVGGISTTQPGGSAIPAGGPDLAQFYGDAEKGGGAAAAS